MHLQAAHVAAVRAIVNMAYGEPEQSRSEVHKGLAVALKSGTPAKKMAAAQALVHVLAPPAARAAMYKLQIIPALVAICAAGASNMTAAGAWKACPASQLASSCEACVCCQDLHVLCVGQCIVSLPRVKGKGLQEFQSAAKLAQRRSR
jgi:hypothetical protein